MSSKMSCHRNTYMHECYHVSFFVGSLGRLNKDEVSGCVTTLKHEKIPDSDADPTKKIFV